MNKPKKKKYPLTEKQKLARRKYIREYMREYYKNNRDKMLKIQKNYQQKNAEKVNEYNKNYRKEHNEAVREYHRKRKHKLRTPEQRRAYNKKVRAGDPRTGPIEDRAAKLAARKKKGNTLVKRARDAAIKKLKNFKNGKEKKAHKN